MHPGGTTINKKKKIVWFIIGSWIEWTNSQTNKKFTLSSGKDHFLFVFNVLCVVRRPHHVQFLFALVSLRKSSGIKWTLCVYCKRVDHKWLLTYTHVYIIHTETERIFDKFSEKGFLFRTLVFHFKRTNKESSLTSLGNLKILSVKRRSAQPKRFTALLLSS